MRLTVNIEDADEDAITEVLELITKQIREGFTSGMDRRESGDYSYTLTSDAPATTGLTADYVDGYINGYDESVDEERYATAVEYRRGVDAGGTDLVEERDMDPAVLAEAQRLDENRTPTTD